jgi:hypothetical protein
MADTLSEIEPNRVEVDERPGAGSERLQDKQAAFDDLESRGLGSTESGNQKRLAS